ncbi:hypothetical protein VNO77_08488 [Canavalia gladiata]|uniref:Uncharacterized protein n=1 Tax=Canavalia gladiata TaxID=3824 RepID=A0AAN9MF67_CANGL
MVIERACSSPDGCSFWCSTACVPVGFVRSYAPSMAWAHGSLSVHAEWFASVALYSPNLWQWGNPHVMHCTVLVPTDSYACHWSWYLTWGLFPGFVRLVKAHMNSAPAHRLEGEGQGGFMLRTCLSLDDSTLWGLCVWVHSACPLQGTLPSSSLVISLDLTYLHLVLPSTIGPCDGSAGSATPMRAPILLLMTGAFDWSP